MSNRIASRRLAMGFVITLVLVVIAGSVGSTGAVFSDSESLHIHLQAGTWACTFTQGYWKNHPDAWPVDEITVGDVTYPKDEAVEILKTPTKGDATYILAHQLIAAKLNVLNGADGSKVADPIAAADGWLAAYPLGVKPSKPEREEGIQLAETLTDYNEGGIGPGHCEDEILALEPIAMPNPNLCTFSMDYWRDHPAVWPVEAMTIGGVTYTKVDAIAILEQPQQGDATYFLARQLISSVLNLMSGSDRGAIENVVVDADQWLVDHQPGSKLEEGDREIGLTLAETLEAYNAGTIGPGACDDEPKTLTSTEASRSISTMTPTVTDTATATQTTEPTVTPTPTPISSETPTPTETETPSPTPTATATTIPTESPTVTNTPTETQSPAP